MALRSDIDKLRGFNLGVDDYLVKPICLTGKAEITSISVHHGFCVIFA